MLAMLLFSMIKNMKSADGSMMSHDAIGRAIMQWVSRNPGKVLVVSAAGVGVIYLGTQALANTVLEDLDREVKRVIRFADEDGGALEEVRLFDKTLPATQYVLEDGTVAGEAVDDFSESASELRKA